MDFSFRDEDLSEFTENFRDDGPYDDGEIVQALKEFFMEHVTSPEVNGYTVDASATLHMDEDTGEMDGYRILVAAVPYDFWLATGLKRPENVTGNMAGDLIRDAVAAANALWHTWEAVRA